MTAATAEALSVPWLRWPLWSSAIMRMTWGLGQILFLIAVICFVLAAVGVDLKVSLVALGLAFGFAGFLVGDRGFRGP